MIGRAAYQSPGRLLDVDLALFAESAAFVSPNAAAQASCPTSSVSSPAARALAPSRDMSSACSAASAGARGFRRYLATEAVKPGAGVATFRAALAIMVDSEARLTHIAAA